MLSDKYRKVRKHGRKAPPQSPLEQHLIHLYGAYQYRNTLPARAHLGEGAQNPRLLYLFGRLAYIDADLAKNR